MNILRNILLWGSENKWLRDHVPSWLFVKRAVKRFMPGENIEEALAVAENFLSNGITSTFTYLGENTNDLLEAEKVTTQYLDVLEKIAQKNLKTEISLKLTQLGLDLSVDKTYDNFILLAQKAKKLGNTIWIDMEGSSYTDKTIEFYKKVKAAFENVGICLQAYLYRTEKDIENLLPISPFIRLVKGAYHEPNEIAFEQKSMVDENYLKLSEQLINFSKKNNIRTAFATHDENLINKIETIANEMNISEDNLEFQMLYGIKSNEQKRLAVDGYRVIVLISYGNAWFPWYMRRLAERPANVWFVLKNFFTK